MIKVLLIGGGGREHAIAEAIKKAKVDVKLYAAMKNRNPGIGRLAEEVLLTNETDLGKITEFAKRKNIDFAVIGPEAPLAEGAVDALNEADIPSIGPGKMLAQIEASKAFMRNLMKKYKISGSLQYAVFEDPKEAIKFIDDFGRPVAIKPVGLTGGKGVKVVGDQLKDIKEAKNYVKEVAANKIGGGIMVIEEKAEGEEFTIQAFADGEHVIGMPAVQDHKRAFEGDTGHNTGGMGSYSDSDWLLPFLTRQDYKNSIKIMEKTVIALKKETGEDYKGVLYGQFMLGKEIKLIEFNCRFGDPEAMNVLSILSSDFVDICCKIIEGTLKKNSVAFEKKATVCKYVVPEGYGINSVSGEEIRIDERAVKNSGALLYYAAVNEKDSKIYTTSSRSIGIVGIADSIASAEKIAETAITHIRGSRIYHRRDIGTEGLIKRKVANVRNLKGAV